MTQRTQIVGGTTYYSEDDDKAFFDWLQSIPCVEGVTGYLRDLHIAMKRPATLHDVRELAALLRRYRMSAEPVTILRKARNAAWFAKTTI